MSCLGTDKKQTARGNTLTEKVGDMACHARAQASVCDGCVVLELACLLYVVNEFTCDIQYSFEVLGIVRIYKHFGGSGGPSSIRESKHRPLGAGGHHNVKHAHTFAALVVICCTSCYDMCYRFVFVERAVGALG